MPDETSKPSPSATPLLDPDNEQTQTTTDENGQSKPVEKPAGEKGTGASGVIPGGVKK